mgnify:CR=1 FL=1
MKFQDKLIHLILAETNGKSIATGLKDGKTAEIVEAMAAQLGCFIALQCGGDAAVMNTFLEGASAYMFECAADKQKAGKFLADPKNWIWRDMEGA